MDSVFDTLLGGNVDHQQEIFNEHTRGCSDERYSYTSLKISTITLHGEFSHSLDLKSLSENIGSDICVNYDPTNKKSKERKKKGQQTFYNSSELKLKILDRDSPDKIMSNVSVMPFPNGKFKIAGCKTLKTCYHVCDDLIDIIVTTGGVVEEGTQLSIKNIKIAMICSDFVFKPTKDDPDGWCLKQEELKNILNTYKGVSATFSNLSRYPGINVKYPSLMRTGKMVTLLIFRSGSVIITGANNVYELKDVYNFIVKVLKENVDSLFYYDIAEDIKVKKKKEAEKRKQEKLKKKLKNEEEGEVVEREVEREEDK